MTPDFSFSGFEQREGRDAERPGTSGPGPQPWSRTTHTARKSTVFAARRGFPHPRLPGTPRPVTFWVPRPEAEGSPPALDSRGGPQTHRAPAHCQPRPVLHLCSRCVNTTSKKECPQACVGEGRSSLLWEALGRWLNLVGPEHGLPAPPSPPAPGSLPSGRSP